MSRKHIDGKLVVQLDTLNPSPYLKRHIKELVPRNKKIKDCVACDLGCGNGRNSLFLKKNGIGYVCAIDQVKSSFIDNLVFRLGWRKLPIEEVDLFLANYVFMFLEKKERTQIIQEIQRVALPDARIMVELYGAVDGCAKTPKEIALLQGEIFDQLSWEKVHWNKGHFIAANKV